MREEQAIDAALDIVADIADGRLPIAQIDTEARQLIRELAGTVIGPEDPAWDVQVDICRQVIAHGGLAASELAEWLATQQAAEDVKPAAVGVGREGGSWIEQALGQMTDGCDGLCAADECVCPVSEL